MEEAKTTMTLREIDAAVAEHVMGWERRSLYQNTFNLAWIESLGSGGPSVPMYVVGAKADYLARPGRFDESSEPVVARESIGALTIGGDVELPRYTTDLAAAWKAVEHHHAADPSNFVEVILRGPYAYACFSGSQCDRRDGNLPLAICLAALKARGIDVDVALPPDAKGTK